MAIRGWKVILISVAALMMSTLACDSGETATAESETGGGQPLATEAATEAPASSGSDINVTEVHLYRDDGFGEAGEEVEDFRPGDHKMHFELVADNLPSGETTKWVFTAVDTEAGKNIEVASDETGEILAADQLTAYVELPNDWPIGTYKAEVYVGDELIYTIDYEVK